MTAIGGTAAAPAVNPSDITYAGSARTGLGRASVRIIENLTGRLQMLFRLYGFEKDLAAGESIFEVAFRRYGLSFDFQGEGLEGVPADGPALVVANHPFGVLDGLALCEMLRRRRGAFQVVANAVFHKAPVLAPYILPISFEQSREAVALNVASRRAAVAALQAGGCVGMFPAGAVAAGPRPFQRPFDPEWRPFVARLVRDTEAAVIPVFFEGENSQTFETLGALAPALRFGLHISEFKRRVDKPVRVHVGPPVARSALPAGDSAALASALRRAVYALSPEPLGDPPAGRRWA